MKTQTALLAATLLSTLASAATPLSPPEALQDLKAGNVRFTQGHSTGCSDHSTRRALLLDKQAPDAIVLACSDSRVPPEVVFDQGLGQLFTIRVAGNILTAETIASIEYAIEQLRSRLIVVMGHASCGAIKAALTTPKGKSAGSPSLDALVTELRTNLAGRTPANDAKPDAQLLEPAKDNVTAVARELVRRSTIVRKAAASGQVRVTKALYRLQDGKVEFWD